MVYNKNSANTQILDYNFIWDDVPFEAKQEFAKFHNMDLFNKSDEYELRNIWHYTRYFMNLEK